MLRPAFFVSADKDYVSRADRLQRETAGSDMWKYVVNVVRFCADDQNSDVLAGKVLFDIEDPYRLSMSVPFPVGGCYETTIPAKKMMA